MREHQIGEHVFVVADNCGTEATIIERRPATGSPASQYKVRAGDGQEFWAYDFEIHDLEPVAHLFPQYDSAPETRKHIANVQARLDEVIALLRQRGIEHDASKLQEPEKAGYDRLAFRWRNCVYGSDAYRAALHAAAPTIQHHYQHNRHHPEHWPDGIAGMSLLDIIEMLCDWKAASERTKQGSIEQSLDHSQERFGIDPQLAAVLRNTVRELNW